MSTSNANKVTPLCVVCKSAGKSKAEYSSHWPRATNKPDAKTTCPYLLSVICGYCKGKGHTPKYCPNSYQNEKRKKEEQRFKNAEARLYMGVKTAEPPTSVTIKKQGKFSILATMMEEEEDNLARQAQEKHEAEQKEIERQKAFPTIASSVATKIKSGLTGWAAMAASKPKAVESKSNAASVETAIKSQPESQPKLLYNEFASLPMKNIKNAMSVVHTPKLVHDTTTTDYDQYDQYDEDIEQIHYESTSWADM